MKDISVRQMGEGDIAAAMNINRVILRRRASPSWKKMAESSIRNHPKECLVAVHGSDVIGFILGEVKEYGFGAEKSGWIEVLGVHPRFMGLGVGKLLGRKLLSLFKKTGVASIFTAVQWDSGDLLAFFRSIGFKRSAFIILENGFARSRKKGV